MHQSDSKWRELTDEQLEVFLILSDFVFEFLVEDLATDLLALVSPHPDKPPRFQSLKPLN